MKYQKLSFIIPVYNEEHTLMQLVNRVLDADLGITKEIILVDDGSRDNSAQILRELAGRPEFKVIFNEHNMGKSQTVRNGILQSTGDLVVIQDADLEYDPQDLLPFVQNFQNTDVQLIYGNRFGRHNKVIYPQNWIGNTLLSYFSALLTGLRARMWIRDMEVCYKMADGDIFRKIGKTIKSTSRFGLEPELTAKFAKYTVHGKHLNFLQLPINYYPRTVAEGKKMSAVKDGIKALVEIVKFNL